ncbi:HAD-IA family hydrolase, partial [Candidatus Collierbacteria bacterium]|nr:HAD-IA family hydrolase [Candidatus Collierbacteria bacterium]
MIKAIIFDMNGVFIRDAGPLSLRIEKRFGVSAYEIYPLIKDILHRARKPGADSRPLWQSLLDRLNTSYDDFFKFWFEGESLNEDLLQFAKDLRKQDIKIIILSNNFPERTRNYRQQFPELFAAVDEQYFSWETGKVKPSPEAFSQVLEKHDFSPSEYVYFDDNDENLAAATKLGIITHKY